MGQVGIYPDPSRIIKQASAPTNPIVNDLWLDTDELGTLVARDIVTATRSSGNITLNSVTWANVDTGLDLTIAAAAGDWLDVSINGRLAAGAGGTHTEFDIATIVSGSPVNYFGTAGGVSDEGLNGLRTFETHDSPLTGSFLYKVQAGDISGGNVTLRLRYRQDSAGNRAFVAGSVNPFKWWAKNFGPVVLSSSENSFIVRKISDTAKTSDAVLANDPHLLFPIDSNEIWAFEATLFYNGGTSGDITFAISVPSGGTYRRGILGLGTSAAGDTGDMRDVSVTTGGAGIGAIGTGTSVWALMNGVVVNGSTAGTVNVQWAQAVSDGTATTLLANSFIRATRIGS